MTRVVIFLDFYKQNKYGVLSLHENTRFAGYVGYKPFTDLHFQFRKIITRYRRIGYNLNVMRQSACLVFNPITVDNYAAFFNCTPVGRASDSMMAPT